MGNVPEPGETLLERLAGAVNGHDLDALEGCFAPGYRPERSTWPAPAWRWFTVTSATPRVSCLSSGQPQAPGLS
jgi:hypothetical protein